MGKAYLALLKIGIHTLQKFRADSNGIYSISVLEPQLMYVAMMVCRLYDLIKYWYSHPVKFRADSNGIYSILVLEPKFMYVAMMVCRQYRKEDTTHLFLPWVSLIHTVDEGFMFDWAKILSDILASRVTEY
jgi:hypothetical protein